MLSISIWKNISFTLLIAFCFKKLTFPSNFSLLHVINVYVTETTGLCFGITSASEVLNRFCLAHNHTQRLAQVMCVKKQSSLIALGLKLEYVESNEYEYEMCKGKKDKTRYLSNFISIILSFHSFCDLQFRFIFQIILVF